MRSFAVALLASSFLLTIPAEAGDLRERATTLVSGQAHSQRWVLILGSYTGATELPADLDKLAGVPDLARAVARIRSSEFRNLMPCYQVVIAGSYADKKAAQNAWQKLKKAGIRAYFKDAGKWVGRQARIEAYCQRRAAGTAAHACGGLRWVERWQKRTFLALPEDEILIKKLSATAPAPKPLAGDLTVWDAPLANDIVGALRKGSRWTLYGRARSTPLATCSIARFTLLTRGTPHFGWLQMHEGKKKKPSKPGCGTPALFAELSCPPGALTDAWLAVVADGEQPAVYDRDEKGPIHEPLLIEALAKGDAYAAVRAKAAAEAKQQGRQLKEVWSSEAHLRDGTRIGLLTLVLMTGEGMNECGGEDLRVELVGAAELDAGGKPGRAIQLLKEKEQSVIQGLVDPDGSGKLWLLETLFPSTQRLAPLDGGEGCAISQQFCDCPC